MFARNVMLSFSVTFSCDKFLSHVTVTFFCHMLLRRNEEEKAFSSLPQTCLLRKCQRLLGYFTARRDDLLTCVSICVSLFCSVLLCFALFEISIASSFFPSLPLASRATIETREFTYRGTVGESERRQVLIW